MPQTRILACLLLVLLPAAARLDPAPSLAVSKSSPGISEALTVTLAGANDPPHAKDWIGLYEADVTPDGNPASIWWSYVTRLGINAGGGSFTFDPAAIGGERDRWRAGKSYKFVLFYDNGYAVAASVVFKLAGTPGRHVVSLRPALVTARTGTAPRLPATVTADYDDGTSGPLAVTWPAAVTNDCAAAGWFTLRGKCAGTRQVPSVDVNVVEGGGPVLRFDALSDTHLSDNARGGFNANFSNALADIRAYHPRADALCVTGDLTDRAKESQYDALAALLRAVPRAPAWLVPGNHDVRWAGGFAVTGKRWLAGTGMPGLYYGRTVRNHLFLFLSTERDLKDMAWLSPAQLAWLRGKLEVDAKEGRPAFVFLHQPLRGTVPLTADADGYGLDKPTEGIVQDAELRAALAVHPRVFLVTGHTHMKVDSPGNLVVRGNVVHVNAAACSYLYRVGGANSQGISLQVYRDKVLVHGRDYKRRAWVPGARWTVAAPGRD